MYTRFRCWLSNASGSIWFSSAAISYSLSAQGVPIGTVMAFVIGGAGVSIPNLVLLNKLFERKLLALYATTVVTIGVVVGVLFNTVLAGLL